MLETVSFIAIAVLAGLVLLTVIPRSRGNLLRGGKAALYATALIAIIGSTLLQAVVVLGGRKLLGRR